MENETKIDELVKTATTAELEGLDFLSDFGYDELAREYNGIGPEWAGAEVREKITAHLSLFEPAALIHDMRNFKSDGLRRAFDRANDEFLHNCLKLADAAYPWYSWKRYRARAAAHLAYDFVAGPGGWKAWMDCWLKKGKA